MKRPRPSIPKHPPEWYYAMQDLREQLVVEFMQARADTTTAIKIRELLNEAVLSK